MDQRVAAASPSGDEVLAAVSGRIVDLRRVDVENTVCLCRITGLRQRGRGVAHLHQIGVTRRRREVLAAQAVGRFHDMDHACVRVRRCQPIIQKLHGGEKRYRDHGEAALRVAQQLGEIYHSAIAEMRTIGLSHSAGEKLARFLLDLSTEHDAGEGDIKLTLTLTHEEIAQMIGASRETVTRLFSDFKKKQLLQIKGSTLIIKNKAGLESVLGA